MTQSQETTHEHDDKVNPDGFLEEMAHWSRELALELAARNDLGPLTHEHWLIINYVRAFYLEEGRGPAVVQIGKATGLPPKKICELFPCGIARGAYRLAGLPRPAGCL